MFGNLWLFYVSFVVMIGCFCAVFCCYKKFVQVPINYVLLSVYTISHAYLVGAVCSQYYPEVVISAAVCTVMMFVGLTALACTMKQDIRLMMAALVTLCIMIITLIILNFIIQTELLHLGIIGLVVVLLAVYIVWDTQMIIGGKKNRFQLELDEYVIGAMIIYSDIITAFLYLLELFR